MFRSSIERKCNEMQKLSLDPTPKIHILLYHVPEFISMTGKPLGIFSEQASESVHFAFNEHAESYKINYRKDNVGSKLLRAVCTFNSLRK